MNRTAESPLGLWLARRLYHRFCELSPELRLWSAGVGAVALVAVGVCLAGVLSRPQWSYLVVEAEPRSAAYQQLCRSLDRAGLTGYQLEGRRLRVPSGQLDRYAAVLAKNDRLPTQSYSPYDEAVQQTSWWTSHRQQDRQWELARQKSLARIIEQMPEVEQATVLIDQAPTDRLRGSYDIRATVTLRTAPGARLPTYRLRQVRGLVAGAVANLKPENVTVVDLAGMAALAAEVADPHPPSRLELARAFEDYYSRKIREALSYLPAVSVTVKAEPAGLSQPDPEAKQPVAHGQATSPPEATVSAVANTATQLPSAPPDRQQHGRPTEHPATDAEVPLKKLTVLVSVPQNASRPAETSQATTTAADPWAQIKRRVMAVLPDQVPATVSVDTYVQEPRPEAKQAADAASPLQLICRNSHVQVSAGILLAGASSLLLIGKRRRDRRRPATAKSPGGPHNANAASRIRQNLVQVQAAESGTGPLGRLTRNAITQFEDLRRLGPRSLKAVLQAVDTRLWPPALRGASSELAERVLDHLPPRTAAMVRADMARGRPVRLADVEMAQLEVLETVRRLDNAGDLVLEDREEKRDV